MLASAVSTNAFENARPTLRSSGSFTVSRHWAVAASFDVGSSWSVRITRELTAAKSAGSYGHAAQNAAAAASALASMSSPVSATAIVLRYPPISFVATFNVGGGGSPTVLSLI